jgi:hypothetical protein
LFRKRQVKGIKSEFSDGKRKVIGDRRVLKGRIIEAEMFIFEDLNREKDTLARLVLMSSRPARN